MMQDLLGAATLGSIYLIFALGMSLVWGSTNILNFAHGSTFMFAAFGTHLVASDTTLAWPLLVLVGMLIGAALAVLTQVAVYRPILRRAHDEHAAHIQVLIGGIGMATIPLAIAQHVTLNTPFGFGASRFNATSWNVVGLRVTSVMVLIVGCAVLLTVAIAWWLRASRSGLALRSIGVDASTSSLMGIDRGRLELTAMAISGALAGLAGVLYTFNLDRKSVV